MAPMRPRRPRRPLLFVLALAGACLLAAPARANEAEDLFAKGNAAYEASNFEEAYQAFLAAWKISKTYDVAANLGQVEIQLGKHRDAVEHLAYAMGHFPLGGDPDVRQATEEAYKEAKKSVATVRLKINAKNPAVTLDGAALSPEAIAEALYLTQGKHVFDATAPGYRSVRRTVDATAGTDQEVTLALVAEQAPGRSPTPAYVLGGIGVVGVVLGAVFVGMAESQKSEAFKLHDEIGSAAGCAADSVKCKALRDATSGADTMGNAGVAAFVFGGLAGLAAGGYLLLPSRSKPAGAGPEKDKAPGKPAPAKPPPAKTGFLITPFAGSSSGGVVVSGSF